MENYIAPELLILVPVLYIIGVAFKKTEKIKDKFIPLILGGVGIVLSCLWVIGTNGFTVEALFTAITQGVLVAGASVYGNQIIKQMFGDKGI